MAKDHSSEARVALANKTAEELMNQPKEFSENEIQLFDDIFKHLYRFAHTEVRQKLSSTLAMADWAPQNLLRELANDDISLALPVLSHSTVISEDILVEVANNKGAEYQTLIAEREFLSKKVTKALIASEIPKVISTLSKNATAEISEEDFAKAFEIIKNEPNAIDNLAKRNDVPHFLVASIYELASNEAKARLFKRLPSEVKEKIENARNANSQASSKPIVQTETGDASNILSGNQIFTFLVSGEKSKFIKHAAEFFDISSDQLLCLISTDLIQNYGFIARALGQERNSVFGFANLFSNSNFKHSPEADKSLALLWMKYSEASAKAHIKIITANM